MVIHSKRYNIGIKDLDTSAKYDIDESIKILKNFPKCNFDETVELSVNLGVNPKKSNQLVRGTVVLPHGTGKELRVIAFCRGEKLKEAEEAGAVMAGDEELIEKVKNGWLDFDAAVATPDIMKDIGKLGRILGPRGMMPNPKAGTLSEDIGNTIQELKKGKIEFKMDSGANIHVAVGKLSFKLEQLKENINAMIEALKKAKPGGVKKVVYINKAVITTTMGPGLKIKI